MGAAAATAIPGDAAPAKPKGSKKKLILIAAPVLLIVILAGLWFSGILPGLLGMTHEPAKTEGKAEGKAEGKVEGKVEGELTIVLRLGTHKFGEASEAVLQKLKAITDADELTRIGMRILDAANWDELLSGS